MSLIAPIEDGKVVSSTSQESLSTKNASNNGMDKEAFLQLLVAQMKYQDPLQPTSNTEYISQYATFSQVEQMQNMSSTLELQRASNLVGEEVYMKVTTEAGNTTYVRGKVDYVVYENGKAYLSINEQLYSLDDLDTVADKEYLDAYDKATDLVSRIAKLPSLTNVDLTHAEEIDELYEIFNGMNDYEKGFVAAEMQADLRDYKNRIDALRGEGDKGDEGAE